VGDNSRNNMIYLIGVFDHAIQCFTELWPPVGSKGNVIRIGTKRLCVTEIPPQFKKYQLPFQKYLNKKINTNRNISYIFEEWPWVLYEKPVNSIAQNLTLTMTLNIKYKQIDILERDGGNKADQNNLRETLWLQNIKTGLSSSSHHENAIIILGNDHLDSFQSKLINEGYEHMVIINEIELRSELDKFLV